MTKYGKPRLKKARRIGSGLSLTGGIRPIDSKCKINNRPGMHGAKRTRLSNYAINLLAKQRFKHEYLLLNKQLRRYHEEAVRQRRAWLKQGQSANYSLLVLLESRLERVIFRMGFARTPNEARQLVSHNKVFVNGVRCNRRGYPVQSGDIIEVQPKGAVHKIIISNALEQAKQSPEHPWLSHVQEELMRATFIRPPKLEELNPLYREAQDKLIVFYSK